MNIIPLAKKIKLALDYPQTTFNLLSDAILRRKITPFPRLIKIYVTNVCNLNCPMCVNAQYRRQHLKNSNLSLRNVKKIMPELKKYKPFVYFSGGEPLLNPEMIKIIKLMSKEKIFTSMTTNGYFLEKFAKDIARSGLDFISLSLDSDVDREHDLGRGVKGSFDRLMSGVTALSEERKKTGKPINMKINTVIRRDNFYKLTKIYDFIEKLEVDEWNLQHFVYKTPAANKAILNYYQKTGIGEDAFGVPIPQNKYFTSQEVKILTEQLKAVKQKSRNYQTNLSIKPDINNLTAYYQGAMPSKSSSCTTPFSTIALYDNGKITTGCLSWKIGHLRDNQTIETMWSSDRTKYFQNLILTNKIIPPCFRCCSLDFIFS